MKITDCKVLNNEKIAKDTYKLTLLWEDMPKVKPGQFVNLAIKNNFLRRPISVSNMPKGNILELVYKIVGEGTEKLSNIEKDEYVNVMGPLGNGYEILKEKEVVLIGGGVGVPPLLELAKQYIKKGSDVTVILGFTNKEFVFFEDEFKKIGCKVYIATDDGSYGFGGNVIECIENKNINIDFVCSCGPRGMLKAVENKFKRGFLSFESRMACGIGVCMACVAKDKSEESMYHRICKEGPVFKIGQIEF